MLNKIKRLLRGEWPARNETWAEYMGHDLNIGTLAGACIAVALVMALLAEVIDRSVR